MRIVAVGATLAGLSGSACAETYTDPAAYCAVVGTIDRPDSRYTGEKVPDWLAEALKRATGAPADAPLAVFKRAAWRCAGGGVMACSYGANIPCDEKADTRRTPSDGAVNFCRSQPGAP